MAKQHELRKAYEEKHPDSYLKIVEDVADIIFPDASYAFDEDKVTEFPVIVDGEGENVYVILDRAWDTYRACDTYGYGLYIVAVGYGSCSVCDALERIANFSQHIRAKPTKGQTEAYMTLALHIVQAIKLMDTKDILAKGINVDKIIAAADSTTRGES